MSDPTPQAVSNRRIEQVVELAAQGLTDKEIAQTLQISKHTVRTYWERLYEKLGVANRTAAVLAFLRETIQRQNQQLLAAHAAQQSRHESSRTGLTSLLAEVQKQLAEYQTQDRQRELFERASHIAHAVAYELASVRPVVHRHLSPSAHLFGMDVAALQQTDSTFYDIVYEDDLPLLYEKSLDADWKPDERYVFLYRFKMPQPRWVLDTHQAIYDNDGQLLGVVGIAIDVHELVQAGVIVGAVTRLVLPAPPVR